LLEVESVCLVGNNLNYSGLIIVPYNALSVTRKRIGANRYTYNINCQTCDTKSPSDFFKLKPG